jgi:NDP-sugar pyrophosphorylase family protein
LLKKLRPHSQLITVAKNEQGPALAIETALPHLDAKKPVLISYCDYGLKWDPWDFAEFVTKSDCDACLVSYRGFHSHYLSPLMYAYSKMENEFVKEIKEKGSFTDQREKEYASCGAYYFKNVSDVAAALRYQKENNLTVNGEYYTSLTMEALLRAKPETHCRIYEIDAFYQWGTPQDLQDFEYWENTFSHWNGFMAAKEKISCAQILMPMAGSGSRLGHLFTTPKPLIPVGDIPMYQRAVNSFPRAKNTVYVTLKNIAEKMNLLPDEKIVRLENTPAGQALSTELGLAQLDPNKDFIVTACDHSVVINPQAWTDFIADPQCEAAIFTIKGFPGTRRSPTSFSYIASATGSFPLVKKISVKQPLSPSPDRDSLLVGSFWFKNAAVAQKGISLLKQKGETVNGELYLDSIFQLLIENGAVVREFPLSGYANWGDPESLKESIYWYEVFMGRSLHPRDAFPGLR